MNKKHWVTVQLDGSLPEGLLEELIEDSYDLIVDKLPARDRPWARADDQASGGAKHG